MPGTTSKQLFYNNGYSLRDAQYIAFEDEVLDTSSMTNMANMFLNVLATDIDGLDTFDTSNVTTMNAMFKGSSIETVDLSSFNTENVTDMKQMFYNCHNLSELNLSTFSASQLAEATSMIRNCQSLDIISFSEEFVPNSSMKASYMFAGNTSLSHIEVPDETD